LEVDKNVFQFLIGTVKTEKMLKRLTAVIKFQFLIGTVKTVQMIDGGERVF